MWLEIREVHKSFDGQPVLQGISAGIERGEVVVLLGPSGCGKTTLLRIVAGLEQADRGAVFLEEEELGPVPVHRRNFGFVFQDFALFPHKNVRENVAFGLRMHEWSAERQTARIQEVLELVGMAGFGDRAVYDLSGGEQQRVALARSLAPLPRLLLLDEPLGSLDRALRERLMVDLRAILKEALPGETPMTAIYVTHDQAEAFAIADRVLVMNQGRIEQSGSPRALYRRPETPFVARFLGMENVLAVEERSGSQVRTALGALVVGEEVPAGTSHILLRPDAAIPGATDAPNQIRGRVETLSFRGRFQLLTLRVGKGGAGPTLHFEFDSDVELSGIGQELTLTIEPTGILPLHR
jgi:ABC-type Fe3+/spermidine/putrescine transport system ATPase subunit